MRKPHARDGMQIKHRRIGAVVGNESVIGATSLVEVGELNQGVDSVP